MTNGLTVGIFAGIIVSTLGNLLITSFYNGFNTNKFIAKVIFWVNAILFILFIVFFGLNI